jgi:hypothetical protein
MEWVEIDGVVNLGLLFSECSDCCIADGNFKELKIIDVEEGCPFEQVIELWAEHGPKSKLVEVLVEWL